MPRTALGWWHKLMRTAAPIIIPLMPPMDTRSSNMLVG